LKHRDFQSLKNELDQLKLLLGRKHQAKPSVFDNDYLEIQRLLMANSRLEDEIAELQRKEEEIITKKWW